VASGMKAGHLVGIVPFLVVSAYIVVFMFLWRVISAKLAPSKPSAAMGSLA
jgi:hypothetical protein